MTEPTITLALQSLQTALQEIRIENNYRTNVLAVYRGRAALNISRPLSGIILTIHNLNDDPADETDILSKYQEHIRSLVIEALVPISDDYDDELDMILDDIRRVIAAPLFVDPINESVLRLEVGSVVFARPEADIAAFQLPLRIGYFVNLAE